MRYSLIENGVVVNVIVADEDFIIPYAAENGYSYVNFDENPDALIGATTTDNVTFDTSMYKKAIDQEVLTVEPTTTGMQEV